MWRVCHAGSPSLEAMFGRRVEPRVDRRVACLAVGVVVATFAPLLALTHAPEPPLARTDVQPALAVDEQRATRVQRRVDEATVQALLAGFEAAPEPVHQ